MKPYERRKKQVYPYYFLAEWNTRSLCWYDGKVAFLTRQEAQEAAVKPGKYRISAVHEDGKRVDFSAFEVK